MNDDYFSETGKCVVSHKTIPISIEALFDSHTGRQAVCIVEHGVTSDEIEMEFMRYVRELLKGYYSEVQIGMLREDMQRLTGHEIPYGKVTTVDHALSESVLDEPDEGDSTFYWFGRSDAVHKYIKAIEFENMHPSLFLLVALTAYHTGQLDELTFDFDFPSFACTISADGIHKQSDAPVGKNLTESELFI